MGKISQSIQVLLLGIGLLLSSQACRTETVVNTKGAEEVKNIEELKAIAWKTPTTKK